MQDEKILSSQQVAPPHKFRTRRLVAAISLLGLSFVAKAQQWPPCDNTAYAKLKPFTISLRDKTNVTLTVDPKRLSRNWSSGGYQAGAACNWCAVGYIRLPFYITDPKTGKVHTGYIERIYEHVEENGLRAKRGGSIGWGGRIIWPPAIKAAATKDKQDHLNHLILHTRTRASDNLIDERCGTSACQGKAQSVGSVTIGEINLTGWQDELSASAMTELFSSGKPDGMRLVQYYRNNRSIVQKQFDFTLSSVIRSKEDADLAFKLASPQVAEWRKAMETIPCDNNKRLGAPSGFSKDATEESCYLTTAAVGAVGLADDCWELETLRRFRDAYLQVSVAGQTLVRRYYRFAPRLVASISRRADARKVWLKTYFFGILPAALCARLGFNRLATAIYRKMTLALFRKSGGVGAA
ncbi:MAG: hypothetical protein LBJ59_00245 [Zoogloeaceae bacterium]|jgi:hypothetical protein|nr:hypothetical protein [Zoogloeaceae bacterium]